MDTIFGGNLRTELLSNWTAWQLQFRTAVYFDQPTHACVCICMVKNEEKHKKIMKKEPFPSCILKAHVGRMKKKVLFHDFLMFFIVFDHANECASMRSLVELHNTGLVLYIFGFPS